MDGTTYAAVVTSDTPEEAWAKIEARCKVGHRIAGVKQMPDDWKPRFAIGFKGFRIRSA